MEKVQHRAPEMITDSRDKTYEDRSRALHMTALEARRVEGDLIRIFKIMNGHVGVDYSRFFSLSGGVLHEHSMKLSLNLDAVLIYSKNIFSNRVANLRNDLDQQGGES